MNEPYPTCEQCGELHPTSGCPWNEVCTHPACQDKPIHSKHKVGQEGDQLTLAQARRIVDINECQQHGHDWEFIMVTGSLLPIKLVCARRCGAPVLNVVPQTR